MEWTTAQTKRPLFCRFFSLCTKRKEKKIKIRKTTHIQEFYLEEEREGKNIEKKYMKEEEKRKESFYGTKTLNERTNKVEIKMNQNRGREKAVDQW